MRIAPAEENPFGRGNNGAGRLVCADNPDRNSLGRFRLADLQQIFKLGKASLFQAGKLLFFIDVNGEFTFLRAGHRFNIDVLHFFLQFGSETRCAGLVPSRSAIDNFNLHLLIPFFV